MTSPVVPGLVRDVTGRRLAYRPAAVLGNGSLLATVSARGELERLFWPRIDREQRFGELRLGVASEGGPTRWLDDEPFRHRQAYAEDAMILQTTAYDGRLEVAVSDHVDAHAPVLVRRVEADRPGTRLDVLCRAPRERGAQAAVDGCLVVAAGDAVLAVAVVAAGTSAPAPDVLSCGLERGALVLCAFGRSPGEAVAVARRHAALPYAELERARLRHDAARLGSCATPPRAADGLAALYRRSLLLFDLVTDRTTGGVVAAPELDPDCVHSGGYGFVWPRDLAFCVLAFLATGREDLARAALRWSVRTQSDDGTWLQRHWTDGSPAPSWTPLQLDETGAVVHAYEAAYRTLRDDALDAALWPAARRAGDFLVEFRDGTGLPLPSFDLWEELEGRHAYTAASAIGGLRAAARLAARHEPARAGAYARAADEVRTAVERRHWDDRLGHYVSSLGERAVDASLLGLAWPFEAVEPGSARMRATAAAVERELRAPGGGLLRYRGDVYAGGNAWVLTTLWLGLWQRRIGDHPGFERSLAFAQRAQTELGLLPEQVAADGRPAWVVPLTWSHAMLVLALRSDSA